MNKNIIEVIQENDPSFDPLALALKKTPFVSKDVWKAACSRVYHDGYYGPIRDDEWEEQDGRKPYSVKGAIRIIAQVLDKVEDYYEDYDGERTYVLASEIRAALVPFYKEIYGVGYPQL